MDTEKVRYTLGRIAGMAEELADTLDEPDVEEGQYWRYKDDVVRVIDVDYPFCAYHSIQDSRNEADIGKCNVRVLHDTAVHLSDETVEEILIEEAERRGYELGNFEDIKFPDSTIFAWSNKWYYVSEKDELRLKGRRCYKEGNWAEVIEDEWQIEEWNNSCYRVVNGDRTIEGVKIKELSKTEAIEIRDALNNMED